MSKKTKSTIIFIALLTLPVIAFWLLGYFRSTRSIFYWLGIDISLLEYTMIGLLYLVVVFNICVLRQNHNLKRGIIGCVISNLAVIAIASFHLDTIFGLFKSAEDLFLILVTFFIFFFGIGLSILIKKLIIKHQQNANSPQLPA
ncbi:MAG: hypothetical protein FWF85_08950 [Clostridiales bacterium]|nr:hypothetical protein [Clostridiales bacterium]MDR2712513.1 hypothetical protein [Clostridiales bacterium]